MGHGRLCYMRNHEVLEVPHTRLRLEMQVAQYLIDMPAANNLDNVSVNDGIEERHYTCRVEGLYGDILGLKYQVWDAELDVSLESLRDHLWGAIFHLQFGVMMRVKGVERVAVFSKI